MRLLYDLGIWGYGAAVRLAALLGNHRARQWVLGRKQVWASLSEWQQKRGDRRVLWLHAASAGEFEQGLPILDALRERIPDLYILVSFFSPSGYQLHKTYPGADGIVFLPEDKPSNVARWMALVRPDLSLFVKYEYWYHFYRAHRRAGIPLWVVSAPFRRSQPFFRRPTARFWGEMLEAVTHFFVLNAESAALLGALGIERVSINGDTRVDRVMKIRDESFSDPILDAFSSGARVVVAGSTWPKDEELLLDSLKTLMADAQGPLIKLILVPHHPNTERIDELIDQYNGSTGRMIRWSKADRSMAAEARILWIDRMGMLSRLYRYANIAWVGGGFGMGIHNILEPAVYGIPVGFGPNYHRFAEAHTLLAHQWAFCAQDQKSFCLAWRSLSQEGEPLRIRAELSQWFAQNQGASFRIADKAVDWLTSAHNRTAYP
jgi:3-deoxy-D-manno-octulosonic-acid transferase